MASTHDVNDYSSLVEAYVDENNIDHNESTGGGGDFQVPEEGPGWARVVEYIELGSIFREYQGKQKPKPEHRVRITFELLHKRWAPIEGENGKYYQRISVELTLSTNERARFYKLFRAMNDAYGNKYKHMAQMVAENLAFKVKVTHSTSGEGDKKRTYANLDNANGWQISAPTRDDEDGNPIPVKVPPANIETRIFLFNKPRLVDWEKLYIDGTREDGTSRNWIQQRILESVSYPGSAVEAMLSELDTPDEPTVEKNAGAKTAKKAATNSKAEDLGDFEDDTQF